MINNPDIILCNHHFSFNFVLETFLNSVSIFWKHFDDKTKYQVYLLLYVQYVMKCRVYRIPGSILRLCILSWGVICRLRLGVPKIFRMLRSRYCFRGGCLVIMVNVFACCCSDAAIRAELTHNELMNRRMIMNARTGTRWYDYCATVMLSLCVLYMRSDGNWLWRVTCEIRIPWLYSLTMLTDCYWIWCRLFWFSAHCQYFSKCIL